MFHRLLVVKLYSGASLSVNGSVVGRLDSHNTHGTFDHLHTFRCVESKTPPGKLVLTGLTFGARLAISNDGFTLRDNKGFLFSAAFRLQSKRG